MQMTVLTVEPVRRWWAQVELRLHVFADVSDRTCEEACQADESKRDVHENGIAQQVF